ncbi:flagellar assembly protein T N-terminal domain-containing protein [Meridianimarinicoccus sp. RP-17]|uniref:flagellar assembly protein T N-terminal domain-containing protein n=1 Tax=Meridianimarinicoccus zhengii TaxID=2056810 RepID=UPI000DAC16B3|nr:flagellar assembly protein T N-terminal domain-containing protein [Phycocomes zhengii]
MAPIWILARMALLVFLVAVGGLPAGAADPTIWVRVTGIAAVKTAGDDDAARRRALADALLTAALTGGAELRGYTAMDRGVITADLAILRPRGRILQHQILGAQRDGAFWKVRIRAKVGPASPLDCGTTRKLVVTAYAPSLHLAPTAPAWSAAFAQALAGRLVDQLDRNPATDLDRVTDRPRPTAGSGVPAGFDYTALTQGVIDQRGGDTAFEVAIDLRASGQTVTMQTELRFTEGTGRVSRRVVANETTVPRLNSVSQFTGRPRAVAEADLARGVESELDALLREQTCRPPEARLEVAGDTITAPVGTRHGLRTGALAVIMDEDKGFGFLDVVALGRDSVTLKPLDPVAHPAALRGIRVEFLDAGL